MIEWELRQEDEKKADSSQLTTPHCVDADRRMQNTHCP